jgi:hypothetical protein
MYIHTLFSRHSEKVGDNTTGIREYVMNFFTFHSTSGWKPSGRLTPRIAGAILVLLNPHLHSKTLFCFLPFVKLLNYC